MQGRAELETVDGIARAVLVSVVALVVLVASGCELVLGIDKHTSHAQDLPDATNGGDDGGDAAAPTCFLPSRGDATLRIGDLVASPARFDFCLRRTDGASPIDGSPILASGGDGCPRGVGYKDVLAPFAVPAGTYELRVITAGRACTDAPIATLPELALGAQPPTTVLLLGDAVLPNIVTLRESRPQRLDTKIRFVHAIAGAPNLDVGLLDAPALPAKLAGLFFADVAFGGVAPPGFPDGGSQSVDANGYVQLSAPGGRLAIGAAIAGQSDALLSTAAMLAGNDSFTFLAIGSSTDVRFPKELWVCDEGKADGIFTRCGTLPSTDVIVDTFNAYLWGPFATLVPLRHDAIVTAVSKLDSDVACITEVWSDEDKRTIIAAAKSRFPYSLVFADTLATQVDDPTDQSGATPPAPATAECAGAPATKLESLLTCVRDNCSTKPGDDAATIIDDPVPCITQFCQNAATALFFGNGPLKACWSCAITSLEGRTSISATRTACTADPLARYAFAGQSSLLVLSRYPISASSQWVLPSTEWRASVLRAEIALPNGSPLDAYCTELTSPQTGITHPYTGSYGGMATDSDGAWLEEQSLQAKKLVAYAVRRSGAIGRRAVISGELYSGTNAGGLEPINPAAFDAIAGRFPIAARADYTPACTFCADNAITTPPGQTPAAVSTWSSLTYAVNVPVTDIVTSSVILKDATIPYSTYKIPLSPYYGYRTVLRVRP